jgi:hypothetical protein
MQPANVLDTSVQTIVATIGASPIMSFCLLLLAGLGAAVLIHHFRQPPRFDPTRHLERPPIEQKPARSLPPASAYVEWERQQDKEKDGVPWN